MTWWRAYSNFHAIRHKPIKHIEEALVGNELEITLLPLQFNEDTVALTWDWQVSRGTSLLSD